MPKWLKSLYEKVFQNKANDFFIRDTSTYEKECGQLNA